MPIAINTRGPQPPLPPKQHPHQLKAHNQPRDVPLHSRRLSWAHPPPHASFLEPFPRDHRLPFMWPAVDNFHLNVSLSVVASSVDSRMNDYPMPAEAFNSHPRGPGAGAGPRQQLFFNDSWPPSPGRFPPTPSFTKHHHYPPGTRHSRHASGDVRDGAVYVNNQVIALPIYAAESNRKWPPSPGAPPPMPGFMLIEQSAPQTTVVFSPNNVVKSPDSWSSEFEQGPLRDEYAPPTWASIRDRASDDTRQSELRALVHAQARAQAYESFAENAANAGFGLAAPVPLPLAQQPMMDVVEEQQADLAPIPTPATDEAVAKSALSLIDWAVDILAVLVGRRVAVAGDEPSNNPIGHRFPVPVITAVRQFTHQVISQTLTSPAGLILGLFYLSRLPVAAGDATSATSPASPAVSPSGEAGSQWSDQEKAFRADLANAVGIAGLSVSTSGPALVENVDGKHEAEMTCRLFVLALMLSNKWLEDNTFTNKTWHDVTGIPLASLRTLESHALAILSHNLAVQPSDWLAWLQQLRSHQAQVLSSFSKNKSPSLAKVIGRERESVGLHRRVADVLEKLMEEVHGLDTDMVASPRGDVMMEMEEEENRVESMMAVEDEQDGNIDLDADGPLRDTYHSQPRSRSGSGSVTGAGQGQGQRFSFSFTSSLPAPAEWNPASAALDSPQPPSRPRPVYEAIQRPMFIFTHHPPPALNQHQQPQQPQQPAYMPPGAPLIAHAHATPFADYPHHDSFYSHSHPQGPPPPPTGPPPPYYAHAPSFGGVPASHSQMPLQQQQLQQQPHPGHRMEYMQMPPPRQMHAPVQMNYFPPPPVKHQSIPPQQQQQQHGGWYGPAAPNGGMVMMGFAGHRIRA